MAFLITSDGERTRVPLDHDLWKYEFVGLYPENVELKDVWILETNHHTQVVFDHEPTENEILYAMSSHGLKKHDVVIVEHGYQLDYEWED